jgi:penicillin-binding protein 2
VNDTPRLRLAVVAIIALSLFAALFARLWYLQVLSAPDFQLQAAANQTREVLEPAARGRILDRNGDVLVDNRASNVVAIDRTLLAKDAQPYTDKDGPHHPPALQHLLERLSAVLAIPAEELGHQLDSVRVSPYTPVPIAEDVDEAKMTQLLERADEFPAVVAKRVAVRQYPKGSLAAHILGYVGDASAEDLAAHPELTQGDILGRSGVEAVYDADLRGTPGKLEIEVDAKGKPVRVLKRIPPVQGHDVVLSIDMKVQETAETALREGLLATQGKLFEDDKTHLKADAGSVVVLDTKGSVEALASYPTFDLPGLADGMSQAEYDQIFPKDGRAAPQVNRALQGRYAPGSTWKLVTADAALRSGLISPNFTLNDPGTYTIPGDCTGKGCIRRNAGSTAYGLVDVRRALAVSSDVFFYTLGGRFWQERAKYGQDAIQDVARQYGFGSKTNIPLSEFAGQVLTKDSKNALHDENPLLATAGWYTGDNVNLAIGQGVMTVTPIQIANAYATFANGGHRYQPNIALRIQDPDGTVVREFGPREVATIPYEPANRQAIMQGLERALTDDRGTATNAFAGFPLKQFGIAGKTGTAQAKPKQDTALFAAFGPTQDLANGHVVTVVMEQSGFGASAAAPVARRVFETIAGVQSTGPVQFTQVNGAGD